MTSPSSASRHLTLASSVVIVVAVALIYRAAIDGYFFNDDFQWLQEKWTFDFLGLLHPERYDHFYRPLLQIYFYLSGTAFGCQSTPFHIESVVVHLLNTWLLYLLARDLTRQKSVAGIAAALFAVQSSDLEAVAWISAIAELLATTWALLALWLHIRFLSERRAWPYVLSLAAFALCLLTHESSAALLPSLVALELTILHLGLARRPDETLSSRIRRYVPHAALLAGSLAIAAVVNSRSYVVQEGHYALGWHVVTNVLDGVIALYVGKHAGWSYAVVVVVLIALVWRGSWPVRFAVGWLILALAPFSGFSWGIASRYLYTAAAAFSLLLAAGISGVRELARRRWSPAVAAGVAAALAIALALRFGIFAAAGSRDARDRARPYEHYAEAVRSAREATPTDALVLAASVVENIPDIYREPAARVALCSPTVTVTVR